jgi:hypothetical protein
VLQKKKETSEKSLAKAETLEFSFTRVPSFVPQAPKEQNVIAQGCALR